MQNRNNTGHVESLLSPWSDKVLLSPLNIMCEYEFSEDECHHVTNTLPLAFCSPLRAVTHSKQGACWPVFLVCQLSGCLLKWQEPKAGLNSIESSAVSGTSGTGQGSSWSSFQMDWVPAYKRNTYYQYARAWSSVMTEFLVPKTIQFTFCVVSNFSYIDNVSQLYLMGKLHRYLPIFGVTVIW